MNVSTVKRNLLLVFSALIVLSACTKIKSTEIGSDLIPSVDGVITKDTVLDVITKNVTDSFIRVNISNDHSLGYVNDQLFGKTTSIINVQLKPESYPFTFPVKSDSMYYDSVVLVLSYRSSWGDTTQPISLRVYEIDPENNFIHDTAYPSFFYPTRGQEITENHIERQIDVRTLQNYFHPVLFREDSLTNNQVRIRLDSNFGRKLLFDPVFATGYANDTLFTAKLKGFQIVPQATSYTNSLMHINLLDTNTKLALYYRYRDTAGKIDTSVRYFRTNQTTSATCNTIIRNRAGAQIAQFLPKTSATNDSLIFLDAGPGTYASIKIPNVSILPNMLIHRAELIVEQEPDFSNPVEYLLTPPNLFLAAYNADSMRLFGVPNAISYASGFISNLGTFGSYPISKSVGSSRTYSYSFDITRYVQGVVTRKDYTYSFILWAPYYEGVYTSATSVIKAGINSTPLNEPASGRIRVGGGSVIANKPNKMRLHIVYSKI